MKKILSLILASLLIAGALSTAVLADQNIVKYASHPSDSNAPILESKNCTLVFSEGFDEGFDDRINGSGESAPGKWLNIDADGDGKKWALASTVLIGTIGLDSLCNSCHGADFILSQSYDNNRGVLYPDNWLVTPEITLGAGTSYITFNAWGQDGEYADDRYNIAVYTAGSGDCLNVASYEFLKDQAGSPLPDRIADDPGEQLFDLSAYAGKTVRIAIVHHNCSDSFYLDVDCLNVWTSQLRKWTDDGIVGTLPSGVDGVYIISTPQELAALARKANTSTGWFKNKTFVLANDIDLSGYLWEPIGKGSGYYFEGTIDGNGHSVTGMRVMSDSAEAGFIGHLDGGTVRNLTVSGTVTSSFTNTSTSADLGGIAGYAYRGATIKNCRSKVDVTGYANSYVGGIVGLLGYSSTVDNCSSDGLITGGYDCVAGGLAGYLLAGSEGSSPVKVINSYSSATVIGGDDSTVGGLVGTSVRAQIINCYSRGSATSGNSISTRSSTIAGGFLGYNSNGIVENCYSTGESAAGTGGSIRCGAFLGTYLNGSLANCFYADTVPGTASGLGALPGCHDEDEDTMNAPGFEEVLVSYVDRNPGKGYFTWEHDNKKNDGFPSLVPAADIEASDIVITGLNSTYDGKAKTVNLVAPASSYAGTVTFTFKQDGNTVDPEKSGTYDIYATVSGGDVYKASTEIDTGKDLVIGKKDISVVWTDDVLVYNGQPQTPSASLPDMVSGDNVHVDIDGGQTKAGSGYTATASLSGTDMSNYNITGTTKQFSIAQKEATVEWSNTSLYFNGKSQAPTATLKGIIGKDDVSVSVSGAMTKVGANYNATAILTGNDASNYKLSAGGTAEFSILLSPDSYNFVSKFAIAVKTPENGTVSVESNYAIPGVTVSVKVSPDEGYSLDTLKVRDSNGKSRELTPAANGTYTFKMPYSNVIIDASFTAYEPETAEHVNDNFFVDVNPGDWFYDAVIWAIENDVTEGVDSTHFAPYNICSRAQMITFLWRAAGSPVVNFIMPFADVPEDEYYAEAVRWAASEGITNGPVTDSFEPSRDIDREELVTFLYNYAKSRGQGFTGMWMFPLDFNDASEIADWANEGMHWCVMKEIVKGIGEHTLAPRNITNRAQIVTMLYRYFMLEK